MIKSRKKMIAIIVTMFAIVAMVFFLHIRIRILEKNMPAMQDLYFLEYENEYAKNDTIIYKYDAKNGRVEEIGKIDGYFCNCIIDDEKESITGLLRESSKKEEYNLVKYYLKSKTWEECLNEQQINSQEEEENYDIEGISFLCIFPDYNGKKYALFKQGNYKNLYLYDCEKNKEKCIVSAGWNQTLNTTDIKWDESGEYLFYIKYFSGIVWNYGDIDIKVHNLKTGKNTSVFKRKNSAHLFEFIQDADWK